jgi:hypothetical protein
VWSSLPVGRVWPSGLNATELTVPVWPARGWPRGVGPAGSVFRHLALPAGELRDAAPKLLRYRLLHLPARLTRGQRKRP